MAPFVGYPGTMRRQAPRRAQNVAAGDIFQQQAGVRNRQLNARTVAMIKAAANAVGVEFNVFSGAQINGPAGNYRGHTGSVRHNEGIGAADGFLVDPLTKRQLNYDDPKDRPVFEKFVQAAIAAGATGIGAGDEYMEPGSIHVGFGDHPPGSALVWGKNGETINAPAWLVRAAGGVAAPGVPAEQAVAKADTNYDVKTMQADLRTLGFDPGPVDGIMGRQTRAALAGYQQAYGVPAGQAAEAVASAAPGGKDRPFSGTPLDIATRVILAEARGEGLEGMAAVANVMNNRVKAGMGDLQKVVTAKDQFAAPARKVDAAQYRQAQDALIAARDGISPDNTRGALYFYNPKTSDPKSVAQINAAAPTQTAAIGNHVFQAPTDVALAYAGGAPPTDAAKAAVGMAGGGGTGVSVGPSARLEQTFAQIPRERPVPVTMTGGVDTGVSVGPSAGLEQTFAQIPRERPTLQSDYPGRQPRAVAPLPVVPTSGAEEVPMFGGKPVPTGAETSGIVPLPSALETLVAPRFPLAWGVQPTSEKSPFNLTGAATSESQYGYGGRRPASFFTSEPNAGSVTPNTETLQIAATNDRGFKPVLFGDEEGAGPASSVSQYGYGSWRPMVAATVAPVPDVPSLERRPTSFPHLSSPFGTGKLDKGQAFVTAILSGNPAAIKQTYDKLGVFDAGNVKTAVSGLSPNDARAAKTNVIANKGLFGPTAYSMFEKMTGNIPTLTTPSSASSMPFPTPRPVHGGDERPAAFAYSPEIRAIPTARPIHDTEPYSGTSREYNAGAPPKINLGFGDSFDSYSRSAAKSAVPPAVVRQAPAAVEAPPAKPPSIVQSFHYDPLSSAPPPVAPAPAGPPRTFDAGFDSVKNAVDAKNRLDAPKPPAALPAVKVASPVATQYTGTPAHAIAYAAALGQPSQRTQDAISAYLGHPASGGSTYTPEGYKSANFNPISGGAIFAYQPNNQGGGTYYDSSGTKRSY